MSEDIMKSERKEERGEGVRRRVDEIRGRGEDR